MSAIQPELTAMGVGLAIVGSGTPAHARDFQAARKLDVPLYVDPGLKAFRAFAMKRSVAATLSPASFGHAFRALLGGHVQGAVAGDPWQQGGVLLVMPDGSTPYVYRSEASGDHPPPKAILDAARSARPQAGPS